MKRDFERVCQFKVTLRGIRPPIWRRIQVPETYTFWDLHVAIQDAMGWFDSHLHEFDVTNPSTGLPERIGIPHDDMSVFSPVLPDSELEVQRYFTEDNPRADYDYDFGDGWRHSVVLEKVLPREQGVRYPICLAGRRACPPEDCGGRWGYEELLRKLSDPDDPEHEEMLEWVGGEFDPEHFDPGEVDFADPRARLDRALAFR